MLNEYKPRIIDKELFVRHYKDKRLDTVIEDMGWISEANRALHSLEISPDNQEVQERVWILIAGMQHDLPLGGAADIQLQRLKSDLQSSGNYNDMSRYSEVLDDLMLGYRKILKERHQEL